MKRLVTYFLCASLCVFLSLPAFADGVSFKRELPPFTGIVASDFFNIVIKEGTDYSVELTLDERVADFCEYSVKGAVFYVQLNEREFSKELKAELRKKPLDRSSTSAVITVPSGAVINGITADEDVSIRSDGRLNPSGKLTFKLTDRACVSSFDIKVSDMEINLENTAKFLATASADNIEIIAANNSEAKLEVEAANCRTDNDNSSRVSLKGKFDNLTIETRAGLNWPKVEVEGNAETAVVIKGRGYADINLSALLAKYVDADLSVCTCRVNVSEKLKLLLGSGAKLYYEGTPAVEIEKIDASTVMHSSDSKD